MDAQKLNVVITSGGFDPLHSGHIEYLRKAKQLFDDCIVICIVNDDKFLIDKKGYAFQSIAERLNIIEELKSVDVATKSIDKDNSVCETIELLHYIYAPIANKIVFAKGGDRTKEEIPEKAICEKLNIEIIDGLGQKINSSSAIVERVKNNK